MTLIDEIDDITDYDMYNMQRQGYNPYEEAQSEEALLFENDRTESQIRFSGQSSQGRPRLGSRNEIQGMKNPDTRPVFKASTFGVKTDTKFLAAHDQRNGSKYSMKKNQNTDSRKSRLNSE